MQMMDDAVYYSGFCKEEQVLAQVECGFMLVLRVYSWDQSAIYKHKTLLVKFKELLRLVVMRTFNL